MRRPTSCARARSLAVNRRFADACSNGQFASMKVALESVAAWVPLNCSRDVSGAGLRDTAQDSRALSIAARSLGSSGAVLGEKRPLMVPSGAMTNFSKFQVMSPLPVSLRSHW